MTKTNLQLVNFINFARMFIKQHEEKTKFRYALERIDKRLEPHTGAYMASLYDLDLEHAATDEKSVLITGEKEQFRYTKDGLRARSKARQELLAKTFEFEPYFATELPDNLSEVEKQVCAGFVLKEEEAAPLAVAE